MPGLEKTSLAITFAHRRQNDFEGVYWVHCAGQSLAASTAELAIQAFSENSWTTHEPGAMDRVVLMVRADRKGGGRAEALSPHFQLPNNRNSAGEIAYSTREQSSPDLRIPESRRSGVSKCMGGAFSSIAGKSGGTRMACAVSKSKGGCV